MNHPDLHSLTDWAHDLLPAEEYSVLQEHVTGCSSCEAMVMRIRGEAKALSREIASPARLDDLKSHLLEQSRRVVVATKSSSFRSPSIFSLGQFVAAAALLIALGVLLLNPSTSRHTLREGSLSINGGSELKAPAHLDGVNPHQVKALSSATLQLVDGSLIEMDASSEISLEPVTDRGVQAELLEGAVNVSVKSAPQRFIVRIPAGRIESTGGRYELKLSRLLDQVRGGASIQVHEGAVAIHNDHGSSEAATGELYFVTNHAPPLIAEQDARNMEGLLGELERLVRRSATLQAELDELELANEKLLKVLELKRAVNMVVEPK